MPPANTINDVFSRIVGLDDQDKCWNFQANTKQRYPQLSWNNKPFSAHVWIWTYLFGPPPKGYDIHHKCENTFCVNPLHLELKTKGEHNLEHPRRGMTHCGKGHLLSGYNCMENLIRGRLIRQCRTCFNERRKERRARGEKY